MLFHELHEAHRSRLFRRPRHLLPGALAEGQLRRPIITVTVDTGGIDAAGAKTLAERALALGAIEHHQIDARADYFEQVLRFLVMGNVRRGQLYPLCVGAERVMQAQTIALMARKLGTNSIAHGCTAAGNDQVRFEVALRTLAPELEVIAPVRDKAFKRQEELDYLTGSQTSRAAFRRGVFDQPRPVGRDHWRQGNADIRGKHPGLRLGAVEGCVHESAAAGQTYHAFREGPPDGHRRQVVVRRRGRGAARDTGCAVRHWPRHPPRRHHHRHQGPGRLRSARRRNTAGGASRAREAGAHAATAAHQGIARRSVWRLGARGPVAGPGVPRHRGAVPVIAGARHRQGARAVPPRQPVHRGRRVPLLAHGRVEGRVRRICRRMDAAGCVGLFQDCFAHGHVPCARGRQSECVR